MNDDVSGWLLAALSLPVVSTMAWFLFRLTSGRWIDEADPLAEQSTWDLRTDRWTELQEGRRPSDPLDPP